METIPPIFWMIIIGFLTVFVSLILYYIAMLFKETSETVSEVKEVLKDSRKMFKNIEKIIEESTEIVSAAKRTALMLEGTVVEAKEHIIQPIRKIGGVFSMISSFFEGLRK